MSKVKPVRKKRRWVLAEIKAEKPNPGYLIWGMYVEERARLCNRIETLGGGKYRLILEEV